MDQVSVRVLNTEVLTWSYHASKHIYKSLYDLESKKVKKLGSCSIRGFRKGALHLLNQPNLLGELGHVTLQVHNRLARGMASTGFGWSIMWETQGEQREQRECWVMPANMLYMKSDTQHQSLSPTTSAAGSGSGKSISIKSGPFGASLDLVASCITHDDINLSRQRIKMTSFVSWKIKNLCTFPAFISHFFCMSIYTGCSSILGNTNAKRIRACPAQVET